MPKLFIISSAAKMRRRRWAISVLPLASYSLIRSFIADLPPILITALPKIRAMPVA